MRNKLFILICAAVMAMNSCTKPLPITIPQAPGKLCIASQLIPNQFILVTVSKSFTSLYSTNNDTSSSVNLDFLVSRARVTVSYANKIDTLFAVAPGIYSSINTLISAGTIYTLNVFDSASNQSVSAITEMEKPTVLDDLKVKRIEIQSDSTIDTTFSFHYSIKDTDPARDNYYFVSVSKANVGNTISNPSSLFNIASSSNVLKLVSDASATNGFITDSLTGLDVISKFSPSDTVLFMVSSISKDYFKYLTAFKKSNSIFNQITGEPINYPSNIQNGYGFFTAHVPSLRIINLRNP
jgi:hypothetical protein